MPQRKGRILEIIVTKRPWGHFHTRCLLMYLVYVRVTEERGDGRGYDEPSFSVSSLAA